VLFRQYPPLIPPQLFSVLQIAPPVGNGSAKIVEKKITIKGPDNIIDIY
jgi:hypothetical protein